jgi:hypothetical protein
MALGSTQPLMEMSTRNLPGVAGGKGRLVHTDDNLTALCDPQCLTQPYGTPQPGIGIAYCLVGLTAYGENNFSGTITI